MDLCLDSLGTPPAAIPPAPHRGAAAEARAIWPLTAIGPAERTRVGDKAWQLARLARAGLPVPAGFCLAADAIPDDCADRGELPPALVAAIRAEYRRLGGARVAVRSSASDEDQPEGSAAGLYTSFLNVRGEAELLAAIFACWQARLAPRARLGRGKGESTTLAVLVQTQVVAEAAGVLFTADPLGAATGHADALLINAVPGLGEPLAAGRVSGDLFRVSARGELLSQTISRKETMLTADGERPVPAGQRQRPSLTPPQIRRLAELASEVARHFGAGGEALDIEFAIAAGQPVLLQARPIPPQARRQDKLAAAPDTTGERRESIDPELAAWLADERRRLADAVAAGRASGRIQGDDVIWSAGNIRELLPSPSAFSFGLFRHIFAGRDGAIVRGRRRLGYRLGPQAGEGLFALIAGQPCFNLEIDAATYDTGVALPLAELLAAVHADPAAANYPELGLYPRLLAATPGGAAAADGFRLQMHCHAARYARRYPLLLAHFESVRRQAAPPSPELDGDALRREIARTLAALRSLGTRFVLAARFGFFFADLVRRRLGEDLAAATAERCYARLLQGLPGSRITEQGLALERLATGAIDRDAFLGDYGHMASNELELLLPRLAETPGELERQIADLRASGRQPAAEFARQRRQRARCEAALRRVLGGRPAARATLFADLAAAQTYLPLRETLKYHLAAGYARLRELLLALADRLQLPPDSFFHLEPEAVLALDLNDTAAIAAASEAGRARRELARRLARQCPVPPVLFASRLDQLGADAGVAADPSATGYAATAIAPGVAEGIVRCLHLDEAELDLHLPSELPQFRGNEIIVAASANLGLAPLFRAAAGVVVEVGGVLAHSACQAREAGIPALVLAGATRLLHDGDRVRIDAQRGLVSVLARASAPREGLR